MSIDSLKQSLIENAKIELPGENPNFEAAHSLGSRISFIFSEDPKMYKTALESFGYQDIDKLRDDALELSKWFHDNDLPFKKTTPEMVKHNKALARYEARWKTSH